MFLFYCLSRIGILDRSLVYRLSVVSMVFWETWVSKRLIFIFAHLYICLALSTRIESIETEPRTVSCSVVRSGVGLGFFGCRLCFLFSDTFFFFDNFDVQWKRQDSSDSCELI